MRTLSRVADSLDCILVITQVRLDMRRLKRVYITGESSVKDAIRASSLKDISKVN